MRCAAEDKAGGKAITNLDLIFFSLGSGRGLLAAIAGRFGGPRRGSDWVANSRELQREALPPAHKRPYENFRPCAATGRLALRTSWMRVR